MELYVKSRNIELTPKLKSYIERKLGRFDRKLENIMETKLEVFEERSHSAMERQVVTVNISGANIALHAEGRGESVQMAVDQAAESIMKQIERRKGKWQDRGKTGRPSIRIPDPPPTPAPAGRIAEMHRIEVKPMSLVEAQDQIDLLGYDYLMFFNTDNKEISLLTRRPDGRFNLVISGP